jgi:predicted metal-dependent HD superfamily phosphohydrolase
MTSKEETMESAEEITTPEEFSNDVAHALASKPRDVLAAILRDRDIAIRLDERQATEAKVREEYAGLVERAYRKGYDDGFEDGCSDTPATATQMKAAIAALEVSR